MKLTPFFHLSSYMCFKVCKHLVRFSKFILGSNTFRSCSHKWWEQKIWNLKGKVIIFYKSKVISSRSLKEIQEANMLKSFLSLLRPIIYFGLSTVLKRVRCSVVDLLNTNWFFLQLVFSALSME